MNNNWDSIRIPTGDVTMLKFYSSISNVCYSTYNLVTLYLLLLFTL